MKYTNKPNNLLDIGDLVITLRGKIGTIESYIDSPKYLVLRLQDGSTYTCVRSACKEIEL